MTLLQFLTKEKKYKKIKLAKISTQHLVLNVKVNNVNGYFILDTGASASVINLKNKKKFRLVVDQRTNEGVGAGASNLEISMTNNNTLAFGAFKIKDFSIILMDLGHVNGALKSKKEAPVDGVLGADLLIQKKGIIDYEKLNLYLINS